MLQEGAISLVESLLPAVSAAEFEAAFDRAQALLLSLGITGWQDAIVGAGIGGPDNFDAYLRAAESGRLTARVRGALWWERDRGPSRSTGSRRAARPAGRRATAGSTPARSRSCRTASSRTAPPR